MAVTPNSIVTPQAVKSNAIAQAFTANTNYTAPANTVLIVTAGPNGARLVGLRARPLANVTATELQEFRSKNGGSTKTPSGFAEQASAHTKNQTTKPPTVDFGYSDQYPKLLEANEQIYVAVGVAGTWAFEAEWQDF